MCRSHADGGRLCPSQTDPAKIANRNARRRAAYAKKKQGIIGTPHSPNLVEHASQTLDRNFYGNFKAPTKKALYTSVSSDGESDLGISSTTYEGYLVEKNYLDSVQVKGKIDYSNLDKDSYKEFGFQDPNEVRRNSLFIDELAALSGGELDKMTAGEKSALAAFTGSAYKWINGALYKGGALRASMANENEEKNVYFPEDGSKAPWVKPTPNCLKQLTEKIDSAMRKNVGEQKTVYRGMKFNHSTFGKYDGEEEVEGRVANYVAENYPLGQELKFDGYQSASYSPIIANEYSSSHGLVFEIKTASGVNVTDISIFDTEREAILPRDARYMVVGVHNQVYYKVSDADITLNPSSRTNVTVVQLIEINDQGYVKSQENQAPPPALTEKQLESEELPEFLKKKMGY
jgi:hypothetical protein